MKKQMTIKYIVMFMLFAWNIWPSDGQNRMQIPQKMINDTIANKETVVAEAFSGGRWMEAMKDSIKNTPLNRLFIPGSHDSGTYYLENTIAKNQDLPEGLNWVTWVLGGLGRKWSQAQNLSIIDQLYAGVRYLDLRVVYRDEDKDFYIVHGFYGPKLFDVMEQIHKFLEENPKEIVIIQVGDLRYMPHGQADHKELINTMIRALRYKLAYKGNGITPTSTVQDFWDRGYQALIIYNDYEIAASHPAVFTNDFIYSYWPNVDTLAALKERLLNELKTRMSDFSTRLYVVQAQMTARNILASGYKSLAEMASAVKKVFPELLSTWKQYTPNIIITDFVDHDIARQIYQLNQ